ncbi:MAG: hypothetical protein DRG09_01650 [Epsilonproteobacteria bacterium]|nr:MAG: hypothetical protein DRG09_01650 [Campylobacterota bacterium]
MSSGPWDDPVIQGYLREWRSNVQRCVKKIHPRCNVDPFGRMYGVTNTGGVITINYDPDGIPDTVLPTSREYYYTYFHAPLGDKFYPYTGLQYIQFRQNGTNPGSLLGCSP